MTGIKNIDRIFCKHFRAALMPPDVCYDESRKFQRLLSPAIWQILTLVCTIRIILWRDSL
jgi:hypothetical protein